MAIDRNRIRFYGRHANHEGCDYFSYSASGFEVLLSCKGSEASVSFIFDSVVREIDKQFVSIYVDDVFHGKAEIRPGKQTVTVDVADGGHPVSVRLIKVNEVYLSELTLEDVVLEDAELLPIAPSERMLLTVYGDSVSCGYGLLADSPEELFCAENEDATETYGYLAAQKLGLDYEIVARSGISIGIPIFCDVLFNEIYDKVDLFEDLKERRAPDFAVINLGTNDSLALDAMNEEQKESARKQFLYEYRHLAERIAADNPNVVMVLCHNSVRELDSGLLSAIETVRDEMRRKYGIRCDMFEMYPDQGGANWHPNKAAHHENAKRLAALITKLY